MTDKEKQIEEMANIMRDNENDCQDTLCPNCKYENCDHTICIYMLAAETLYNAGYHKASDFAREIFAEIESKIKNDMDDIAESIDRIKDPDAIDGQYEEIATLECVLDFIAELKKKYTESEKDNG